MARSRLGLVAGIVLSRAVATAAWAQQGPPPVGISDNSFLIEEAYNQERGVVQHISTFIHSRHGDSWLYTFTQEWPLVGVRHQLSYTVPLAGDRGVVRVGDVALNYRYQLVGPDTRIALSPRVTLLAPTGSSAAGVGAGAAGLQLNLPLSATVAPWLVTHWNAGATITPRARNPAGDRATTRTVNLGASAIWQARPTFNVLLETIWAEVEAVVGPGVTARERQAQISPGVRWAYNFPSGLQIVAGLAVPFGVGPSRGDDALLLYLSFEHPFRKTAS